MIYYGWHPLWHFKAVWFQIALTACLAGFFRIGQKISKLAASNASNLVNDDISGTQSRHSGQFWLLRSVKVFVARSQELIHWMPTLSWLRWATEFDQCRISGLTWLTWFNCELYRTLRLAFDTTHRFPLVGLAWQWNQHLSTAPTTRHDPESPNMSQRHRNTALLRQSHAKGMTRSQSMHVVTSCS